MSTGDNALSKKVVMHYHRVVVSKAQLRARSELQPRWSTRICTLPLAVHKAWDAYVPLTACKSCLKFATISRNGSCPLSLS